MTTITACQLRVLMPIIKGKPCSAGTEASKAGVTGMSEQQPSCLQALKVGAGDCIDFSLSYCMLFNAGRWYVCTMTQWHWTLTAPHPGTQKQSSAGKEA